MFANNRRHLKIRKEIIVHEVGHSELVRHCISKTHTTDLNFVCEPDASSGVIASFTAMTMGAETESELVKGLLQLAGFPEMTVMR